MPAERATKTKMKNLKKKRVLEKALLAVKKSAVKNAGIPSTKGMYEGKVPILLTKKSMLSLFLVFCMAISINQSALAYPTSDTWYLVHNSYVSNLYKTMNLSVNGNGYYAKITSTSGNDPLNAVSISCPSNNVSNLVISVPNVDVEIHPSAPYYSNTVEFDITLLYNTSGSYYSTNSGGIRTK